MLIGDRELLKYVARLTLHEGGPGPARKTRSVRGGHSHSAGLSPTTLRPLRDRDCGLVKPPFHLCSEPI